MIYVHILIKIWAHTCMGEVDQTWLSGIVIFICTYLAGITGAIMPCSILSEVTATVIGSAISSLSFVKFDFLETLFLPGAGLSDETLFRVFIIHAAAPTLALIVTIDHLNYLHATEYTDEDEMDLVFLNRHEY
jgi:quinol-cytochrome oxidoreductase complex cytochrome b subunit